MKYIFYKNRTFSLGLFLFIFYQSVFASNVEIEKAKELYFSGQLDKAGSYFTQLSTSGNAEAQYYLGLIYLTDAWQGKNTEKALAYLHSAADQNHAEAMWKIGECFESGQGIERNLLTAIDWYRKSQQATLFQSKVQFAEVKNRQLDLKSHQDMINRLAIEANQGNPESAYKLGKIYDEGRFAEQDYHAAFSWYKKAAENNHKYSMLMLGYFLCRGIGGEVNSNKANEWLKNSGRKAYCN